MRADILAEPQKKKNVLPTVFASREQERKASKSKLKTPGNRSEKAGLWIRTGVPG